MSGKYGQSSFLGLVGLNDSGQPDGLPRLFEICSYYPNLGWYLSDRFKEISVTKHNMEYFVQRDLRIIKGPR